MKTIESILQELFTENTGKHLLDSGGTDGRQWQKNQVRNFEEEDEGKIEFWDGKFEYVTVNTYHYFKQVLDNDEICEAVNERLREENIHWVSDVEWVDIYDAVLGWKCDGVELDKDFYYYASSYSEFKGEQWNTYNGEYNTDHIFQGRFLTIADEPYVLLQLHLGADVRGGYSDVRLFKLEGLLSGFVDCSIYKDGVSVDFRYGDTELYNHDTHETRYVDQEWLEDNIKEGEWEVSICVCDDPCIY